MYSTALILQPATIRTTSLSRPACYRYLPVHEKGETEFRPVHINWTVATDAKGKRRLQMHWRAN